MDPTDIHRYKDGWHRLHPCTAPEFHRVAKSYARSAEILHTDRKIQSEPREIGVKKYIGVDAAVVVAVKVIIKSYILQPRPLAMMLGLYHSD